MISLSNKFFSLVVAGMAVIALSAPPVTFAAEKSTATQLIELAKTPGPALREAITATFDTKDLKEGTAWSGHGPDFFFAIESKSKPQLLIDGARGPQLQSLANSDLWYAAARIEPVGKLHSFYYLIDGNKFGGKLDVPAFGPLSYLQPGVPSGTLSEKIIHASKIYDGMKSEYWIYVPAQ
jgi:hypothetical protein